MIAVIGGSVLHRTGEKFIEKGVILIEGKKIIDVGGPQKVTVPEGAEIISAEGGYVVPGLVDAHNHLYLDGPFEKQSLDPEGEILLRGIRNARKQLHDGVTTLRDCGTPKFLDLVLRQAIAEELIPGPDLVCSGEWVTSSHGHGAFQGACAIADGPDEIRKAVRGILRHDVNFVKVFVSGGTATRGSKAVRAYLGPDELKVVVNEAHNQGKQVAVHLHGGPGVRFAIDAGIDMLEHGSSITDDAEIDLMASGNIAWMFNQGSRMSTLDPEYPEWQKKNILATRESSIVAFQKAKKAGIKIMSGVDGHHDDHACVWALEALVKCGATPQEALLAATRTPTEVIDLDREKGTLEAGKFADLLIVNSNPLQNISALRRLRLVMKQGKIYHEL